MKNSSWVAIREILPGDMVARWGYTWLVLSRSHPKLAAGFASNAMVYMSLMKMVDCCQSQGSPQPGSMSTFQLDVAYPLNQMWDRVQTGRPKR